MAGFQKIYTSENEYLYDVGKSTGYFDEEYYKTAKEAGKGFEYLQLMASAKDNISNTFDVTLYNKLSGEEKFNYFATENFMDKSSNDYKKASEYYTQRQKQIQNQETYDSLNVFQKAINSIGGWVGNTLLQTGAIVEGLIDVGAELLGAVGLVSDEKTKEFISKDTIGYNAAQTALNEWMSKNTLINDSIVFKAINDVSSVIMRMTPMIVGSLAGPIGSKIGSAIYYASMAGNTAEQAVIANPDIHYADLLGYTGASVGLEYLTEWASSKLFGDDVVSALIKGQEYAPTGNILWNIAKNFGTEGLEEATSELFGSIIYTTMVDPTAETATFNDILYAAIIGGLTGAVMSGAPVIMTSNKAVLDGELVDWKRLSKEQRKSATKLSKSKSYTLKNLITQFQQQGQQTDEVTKLMAKYGTSLNNIAITHSEEYQNALRKDTDTKAHQARVVLDLANVLNTIGIEQFTKSAELLNKSLEYDTKMINNFLNHTDKYNKTAANIFSAAFKGQTATPVQQPTTPEQALSKSLRMAYPDKQVVFVEYGSEDGLAVHPINSVGDILFVKSGLVEQLGYKPVMQHLIRTQLADNILSQLSLLKPSVADSLVDLIDTDKKHYSDLTNKEKKALAQLICFDPINNKRTFLLNKTTHAKIFNYITSQAEYVKNFGRQSDVNKLRYHDLLSIRELFLDTLADTIYNEEDVVFVKDIYGLSDEELQTKIKDKTRKNVLNEFLRVSKINFSKSAIFKREAIYELILNKADIYEDFDFARVYDETYYNPEWVASIKSQQKDQDFKRALQTHFETSLKTTLDDRPTFIDLVKEFTSPKDVKKAAEIVLTDDARNTITNYNTLVDVVAEQLYTLYSDTTETTADSIIITDNQIKGTGELNFILGDVDGREDILRTDRKQRTIENTGDPYRAIPPREAKYQDTTIENVRCNVQTSDSLSASQKNRIDWVKETYGLDLQYFAGDVFINNELLPNAMGFVEGTNVYIRYDETVTFELMNKFIEHEVTHKRIDAEPKKYEEFRDFIRSATEGSVYKDLYDKYERMYSKIYKGNEDLIEEELMVNIIVGIENPKYHAIDAPNAKAWIGGFKKTSTKLMKDKISKGIRFAQQGSPTKQPSVATQILKRFEDGSKNLSEVQYSESNSKEYLQVSYDMIDEMGDTFALVNDDNYNEVRKSLEKSKKPYAKQALEIFDLYTIEMVGKFNKENAQKIENTYQKTVSQSGQNLALQAQRVATRKPISDTISTLTRDGFNVSVTDEIVQKYDAKLKDKEAYINELEKQIKELEKQLQNTSNEIDKTALNKQLKEAADKKGVIQNGANSDILDYIVTHLDSPEQAAKLQEDVLIKLINTAVIAKEEGKKVGTYMYDDKGKLMPFPNATKKLTKTLKKLKSFRMWAMLSSPVTWVRNWIGNQGMRSLDAMTNVVEGFLSSKSGFSEQQMKFTESRAGKDLYTYIAEQNQTYIMSLVRGEDVKYETSAEKAAAIKRKERQIEYESANAFKKACLKAQNMTDWGLSTGPLGDEPVVFNSICKNMGNLVANNINFLMKGIQIEANTLSKRTTLTQKEQSRLDTLNKALKTKDAKDVFNALSKEETERLFDVCKERSFQQYFKNPNSLSKWFSKFGTKHPVYAELVSWVMPFPKVAANVLSMAYRYSPLSFFKGLSQLSIYKQTQQKDYKGPTTGFEKAQMIRTFSEATVGTFMLIAGAIFSAMGLIDIDEDDYLGPCIKIGDFKVSLSDLAPSMTTFSTASAVVWAWKNDRVGVTDALNVLYENTLLGNVESLLTYGSFTDIAKNVSISYISQYIPAILKLINKGVTGGVKKDKSGNYLQRLVKTLGSYVPGLSQLVPNKIDPYTGHKVYQAGSENWFLNLLASLSPLGIKWDGRSELEKQAALVGAESTGLSGKFTINEIDYDVKDKEKYSKYRANYINEQFNNIVSGKQKVTVEDENGKRITTTYDKLTNEQKKNVINRLYTEASSMTKIKWWTDQGNKYVVTNRDQYNEYRKIFNNIIYKKTWSKSKFVES